MLQHRSRRPISLVLVASLVVSTTMALLVSQSSPVSARAGATKFKVCHRTNAIKNPYRLINVAWSSVKPSGGHDKVSHDGPVFNVSNPTGSHGTTPRDSGLGSEAGGSNNRWGDIFYAYKGPGNGNSNSNNWDAAGQAVMNGAQFTLGGVTKAACRAMSAQEFIKSEKDADPTIPMSTIMAELDEQGASEDAALLQSLGATGTTFASWYTANGNGSDDPNLISSLIAAESPSVTTEPPSNLVSPTSGSNGTASLNGTVSPSGSSLAWYFEWSSNVNWKNDPTSVAPSETVISSTVTTSQSVTTQVTGLAANTTYYYRTVGVVATGTPGTDTYVETLLYGVIKQFVFGAPPAPTINTLTCGNTKVTVAFTANANVTNVTGYEYSIDGGAYVSSGLTGSASGSFEITGLTNGVSIVVSLRAITASLKGIDSAAKTGSACGAPTPVTDPATNVLQTSATINGTVTANGATTTVTFTWGTEATLTTSPVTTAATPGSLLPAEVLPVSLDLTGLTGNTTYFFKVNVSSTGGSGSGEVRQFTTPNVALPATTTTPATSVTTTSATINGTGTSNGAASDVVFKWGTSSTLASGTVDTNAAQNQLAANASGTAVSASLTNLQPYTTYYYRTIITNTNGSSQGVIRNFTTLPVAPVATTEPATSITATTATLNGTGDPNLFVSDIEFTWGTSSTLASGTTTTQAIESPLAAGGDPLPVTLDLTGLTGGTTYYFRVTITNANGTAQGIIRNFTTLTPPATTTEPATSITTTSATVNGTGTSNGASSDVVFKWGTDSTLSTGTANANATQNSLVANASGTAVSAALANLQPYTTYYFRTIITNTNGSAEGVIRSFTTLPVAPEVITDPATSVTETSATLNGTADPNMFSSDVEFTWSTSSTLATGTTTRQAIESPLSAGGNPLPVTLNLTGLTGGTTYYFRVTITNPNGTVQGLIRSFTTTATTTPSVVPTTTTVAPAPTSAPTTTAPTTTVATAGTGEIGRVIGTAWFDTNKNNKRENSEPLLIGLTIELIPTGVTAKSSGRVRTAATSMLTGSDGSFDFTSVVPGSYRIQGKLPAGYGIDQSWDSTGNNDWTVGVTVVSAKVARGDFAAIGTAEMSGCYSGQTVARELAATWDGFDKKLGTVDDAAFTSSIGKDCNFAVEGVPTGKFAVAAVTETGKVVSKATVEVTPEGGVVKTASLSVKAVVPKVLPQTGSRQMSDLMMLAMYSIAAGAGIFMTSRRRRRL